MRCVLERFDLATALCLAMLPAAAHHSGAMFDSDSEVTLHGTVTKFDWVNPHVYIEVETDDNAGQNVVWMIEGSSATFHRRWGWSPESLAPGDRVTVTANPGRNAARKYARGTSLRKEDGTVLSMPSLSRTRELPVEPPSRFLANDLSGNWLTDPSSPRSQFPTSWPLTAKALAEQASYDDSLNPGNDCLDIVAPLLMISPSVKTIEIGGDVITIRYANAVRTIHMDLDSHDEATFTRQGHSIGWWEDDVLVVDTTHFADNRMAYGRGLSSGARKHLVEQFALSTDRTRLSYAFEVEDSEYLTEPVTGSAELVYRPDLQNMTERCDPEIARRFLEE